MKANKIYAVMDLTLRAREQGNILNPCFVSAPGLGKTEIMQQWCRERNMPSITLTSALLESPDIRGFPFTQVVNGKQRMTTAAPDFWPDEGKGVIILEEVNRGTTAVMNCWMALTDNRRGFDNYKLPDGWIVAACINPEGGDYDTNTMDPALKDRFEMFQVAYDKASFLSYMNGANWHKDIIRFVESNTWMYKTPEEIGNVVGSKYISPRTLSKLNNIIQAGFEKEDEMDFYVVELGVNVAKDFYNFRNNESPVTMMDITKNLKSALKRLEKFADPNNAKLGMISITVKDIIEENTIDDDTLVQVVTVLPVDLGTGLIRDLEFKRSDPTILNRLCNNHKGIKELFKSVLKYNK